MRIISCEGRVARAFQLPLARLQDGTASTRRRDTDRSNSASASIPKSSERSRAIHASFPSMPDIAHLCPFDRFATQRPPLNAHAQSSGAFLKCGLPTFQVRKHVCGSLDSQVRRSRMRVQAGNPGGEGHIARRSVDRHRCTTRFSLWIIMGA